MKTKNFFGLNLAITRPRWMIVDDNKDILRLMSRLVAPLCDADIEYYQSPQAALSAFKSAAGAYELIITDLEMPGMSGIELGRHLRTLAPETKILLATGSGIVTEAEAREMGFCGLLHKPFSNGKLGGLLKSAGVGKIFADSLAETMVLTPA